MLIINKTDLAPPVGADLGVMERDARAQRGDRPFVFTNMRTGEGVSEIVSFIGKEGMVDAIRKLEPDAALNA